MNKKNPLSKFKNSNGFKIGKVALNTKIKSNQTCDFYNKID
jgi:hypothetical protein